MIACPICGSKSSRYREIKDYIYFKCNKCCFIFLNSNQINVTLVEYTEPYWNSEIKASIERAKSSSLERFLELLVLVPIPVLKFLDIGTGGGQLLEEITKIFGDSIELHGIELYPPAEKFRTRHPGYVVGDLSEFETGNFDVITSIEVLEHLDSIQAKFMFIQISRLLNIGGLALINSGNDKFVEMEDADYLDPVVRGHNQIYSMDSIEELIQDLPLKLLRRENSNWSFFLQKTGSHEIESISLSLWNTHSYNKELLFKPFENEILFMLGRESLRTYL